MRQGRLQSSARSSAHVEDPTARQPAGREAPSAELRLARLRHRHESILQSAGEGIFGLDVDGCATFVNAAAARMVGWSIEDLIGRHMHAVVHHSRADGSDFPAVRCPIHAAIRDGTVHQVDDEVFWRRDGSSFPVEYTATPIHEGGEVVGAVVVYTDITARVTAERELRASEALNRAMAAEQAALRRVATAVAGDAESEEIFALVAREVAALMGAESGRVVRFSDAPASAATEGALALVQAGGRAAIWRSADRRRVEVAAPIHLGTTLWGAILSASGAGEVPPAAEERLADFAELVGMAIANAEGRDRIVTDAAAAILQGRLDMGATLQAVAEAITRALGSDRATCYLNTEDGATVEAIYTTTSDPAVRAFLERTVGRSPARMPLWQLLVAQEGLLVVEDAHDDARVPQALAERLNAGAFVGIRLEHASVATDGAPTLLGTLFVSYPSPRRIPSRALTAAASLGSLAALAIANARLHDRTLRSLESAERRAAIDPLTGLANHRTFHESLRAEVARAVRERAPLSVVLLDLDHFKRVNDIHGHRAGDHVLVEVAERLRWLAREGDLVARVGGEEFAWIVTGADAGDALGAAERARAAIGQRPFHIGIVSASVGVCDIQQADGDPDRLIELTDGALYWAKAQGRNRVCRYSPEVVTDLSAVGRADRLAHTQAMASLRALAQAVDAKDPSTRRHSERVAQLAAQLAGAAGWPAARITLLREAGLLHDVGKIGVPDVVLFKPGRLTDDEYEQVKLHAPLGARIAAEVLSLEQVAWIRHHHERWDGRGYPDGLAGADSPDGARLLAIADAWDVMTGARVYKDPVSTEEALAECRRHSGGQFAPDAVDAMARLVERGAVGRTEPPAVDPGRTREDAPALDPVPELAEFCDHALEELRRASGWELAYLSRVRGDRLEVMAVAGDRDLLAPGRRLPLADADSDARMRAALGVRSYSAHPVTLPDGSVLGMLCAIDRRPRDLDQRARRLAALLARLLGGEMARELPRHPEVSVTPG